MIEGCQARQYVNEPLRTQLRTAGLGRWDMSREMIEGCQARQYVNEPLRTQLRTAGLILVNGRIRNRIHGIGAKQWINYYGLSLRCFE